MGISRRCKISYLEGYKVCANRQTSIKGLVLVLILREDRIRARRSGEQLKPVPVGIRASAKARPVVPLESSAYIKISPHPCNVLIPSIRFIVSVHGMIVGWSSLYNLSVDPGTITISFTRSNTSRSARDRNITRSLQR